MMKKTLLTLFLVASTMLPTITANAQAFPAIKGKTLEGKEVQLPLEGKGKFLILGIAQNQKAQEDLVSWLDPMTQAFMANEMIPCKLYLVALTGGYKLIGSETIERKLRSGLDQSYHPYVMTYSGDASAFRKSLNLDDKDKGYVLVVDPRGDVIYKASGKYTEAKLEEMTDKMSE